MHVHKLSSTEAFVAIDLDDAEVSSGPVRWARKVLQGGAQDLARSQTYTYASLGMKRGGASAGISAEATDRDGAVAAFVDECAFLVSAGTYLPDAAKGVGDVDLAPLRAGDPRRERIGAFAVECDAISAVAAADAAIGLDGRTVAIESFGAAGPTLVSYVEARGATVVVGGDGVATSDEAFGGGADIVFAGSKMGAVHHGTVAGLEAKALVPTGRLAYTARALAECVRRKIVAVPDFLALAGSTIAHWSDPTLPDDDIRNSVAADVAELVAHASKTDDGLFLGACYGAESFLSTWQDELPFGRPLAP